MAEKNVFEQTRDALKDLDGFLSSEKVTAIKNAIGELLKVAELFIDKSKINSVFDTLIKLMTDVRAEIAKLDPTKIPGVGDLSEFAKRLTAFLEALKVLVPEAGSVGDAANLAAVLDLKPLEEIRDEILGFIDSIVAKLGQLKIA